MPKLCGLTAVMFHSFCGSGMGGNLAGLFCLSIYCEVSVGCWLGCRLLSTRTSPQASRTHNPTGPDRSANAVYVVALEVIHHHFLNVLLVTQGNSGQCGMGRHKGSYFRRRGLLEALVQATIVTSIAIAWKSACLSFIGDFSSFSGSHKIFSLLLLFFSLL